MGKLECCCTPRAQIYWLLFMIFFGILMVCLAAFVPPALNDMVDSGLDDAQLLTVDAQTSQNDAYLGWVDTRNSQGNPLTYKIYMFNVTNPNEVLAGEAVNVVEVGPYVYTEHTVHSNVTFTNNEDGSPVVVSHSWTFYVFDRASTPSNLNEDDLFCTVNYVFLIYAGIPALRQGLLNNVYGAAGNQSLWTFKTVHEMAFGYNDTALGLLGNPFFPGLITNDSQADSEAKGYDTIMTGEDVNSNIRQYQKYQSSDSVKCLGTSGTVVNAWDSSVKYDANRIYGTDAVIFPRNLQKGGNLQAWVNVIYRTVTVANVDNLEVTFKGIKLLRYVLPSNLLANATIDPVNAAYYAFGDSGMANLTKCSGGASVFMSKPHFLDVQSSTNTTGKVVGLNPNRDLHDTFLDIEPRSGFNMHAAKRLQINVLVQSFTTGAAPPKQWLNGLLPLLYIPVMWVEEGGEIKDSDATDFKSSVYFVEDFNYNIYWIGYIIGFFCIGVGAFLLTYKARVAASDSKTINVEETDDFGRSE